MSQSRLIADQERTRANLLQVGKIVEADYATARVRVQMNDLNSAWLPWTTQRAGGNRAWAAPEIGEQVLVACPDGDPAAGVVMGAIYQADASAPADSPDITRTVYSDGAVIEYDRASHALNATLPDGATASLSATGGVTVNADTGITINALSGGVLINGSLTVTEIVTAQQGISTMGGSGATVQVDGTIESTGDQVAAGISQIHHVHDGVEAGPSTTGEPVG